MKKGTCKFLYLMLSLVLVLGCMSMTKITAKAGTSTYTALIPVDNDNLIDKRVSFGGKSWYIIEDNSTSLTAGKLTLFAASPIGESAFTAGSNNATNGYIYSSVKSYLDGLVTGEGEFAGVSDAIALTNLQDVSVTGAKLYLLSKTEVENLPDSVKKCSSTAPNQYWTRTAYDNQNESIHTANYVEGSDGYLHPNAMSIAQNTIRYVNQTLKVRPALQLDLSKVVYLSQNKTFAVPFSVTLSGGANTTRSGGNTTQSGLTGAMTSVTYTANRGYYFTAFSPITSGGITVTRTSDTVVTVSGTPSANVTISVPDAVVLPTVSATVTFRVVNGFWNDGSNADKIVTLSGYQGSELKLASGDIPGVGNRPKNTYGPGSWDVTPSSSTVINGNTTYTYTYVSKVDPVIYAAPSPKTGLVANGSAQALVTAGSVSGGIMNYALGTSKEATGAYSDSIPTGTNAGTYYVWYKVTGDANHFDTDPAYVTVTIGEGSSPAGNSDNGGNQGQNQQQSGNDNSQGQNQQQSGNDSSQGQNQQQSGNDSSQGQNQQQSGNDSSQGQNQQQSGSENQATNPTTTEETVENVDVTQKNATLSKPKAGKKSFTLKWKKPKDKAIAGYEIQYSTDKKFKKNSKTVTINKIKTTSRTIKKLKSKKKYYVRIRTFKKFKGEKLYSKWSKTKNVKVK